MSIRLDEWRNAGGTTIIQNENLFVKTYIELINQANAGDYNNKLRVAQGRVNISKSYARYGNIRVPMRNPQKLKGGWIMGYKSGSVYGQYSGRFGWGYITTNQTYNIDYGAECLDFMPRLYVKLTPLSDYLISLRDNSTIGAPVWVYTGSGLYISQGDSPAFGFNFNEPTDYTSFIEQASNYYVCEQLAFYTNKSDGTEQALLDGANISGGTADGYNCYYDVFEPLSCSYSNTSTDFVAIGYYSKFMAQIGLSSFSAGAFPMYAPIFRQAGLNSAIITGATPLAPLYQPGITINSYNGYTSIPEMPVGAVHYATRKDWETLLNGGGCPWSYSLDVVTSPDGKGLHVPTTPGQPDNPVDTGDGDGDNISDVIEYPNPSYAPNAYTRYWLTEGDVHSIRDFLFKGSFLENVKRLWTEPGEYIIDLSYVPIDPTLLSFAGNLEEISIGDISSGVQGRELVTDKPLVIYAGSVDVTNYYNSYLDFEPNTAIDIYLPYIGVRPLNASQITGHTLYAAYYLDVNTMQLTAALGLDGDMTLLGGSLGNVLSQYTSSFGVRFPLSGTSANQQILNVVNQVSGAITGAATLAGGVATGSAPAIVGSASKIINSIGGDVVSPSTYGSITPMSGLFAPQLPYLIISRPISAEPSTWAADMGYSAGFSGTVSSFTGYLEALHIDLQRADNMTEDEAQAIIRALEGGIII